MDELLQHTDNWMEAVHSAVWGPGTLALLLSVGLCCTVRTECIQSRLGWIFRKTLGSLLQRQPQRKERCLTPYQAMATTLAGTVGTGNIAGITGALFLGGPGAVFWLWLAASLGMATKFAAIFLAVRYRQSDGQGRRWGGPMYYIRQGLGLRRLAALFALAAGAAGLGIGNLAQSSEIAGAAAHLWGLDRRLTAVLLMALTAIAILGGMKWVGRISAYLFPLMSLLYVGTAGLVVVRRWEALPAAFGAILQGAFGWRAAAGGAAGWTLAAAIRQGLARGIFSNEAGLGSAPIIHAASSAENPVEEGFWGILEVLIDTMVICTLTALAVLLSGVLETPGGLDAFPSAGAAAAQAFDLILPGHLGGTLLEICLLFFALTTLLSWSCCGEVCWRYLADEKGVRLYRVLFILACLPGALGSGRRLWRLADILNGLMAIPNLIALLLLSGQVSKAVRQYFSGKPRKVRGK